MKFGPVCQIENLSFRSFLFGELLSRSLRVLMMSWICSYDPQKQLVCVFVFVVCFVDQLMVDS